MSFFYPQNPGIDGIDELTDAEEAFVTNLAGLPYVTGDILYHNGTDLINLGIGNTNDALTVSGGIPAWQDLYVQTAGDTMTGALTIADLANAINSGDYPIQMMSGISDANGNVGYIFDTPAFSTNDGYVIGQDFRIGGESVMQTRWADVIDFGGANMAHFPGFVTFGDAVGFTQGFTGTPFIDAQYTLGGTGTALSFQVTSNTGIGSAPTALQGTSVISGSVTSGLPKVFLSSVRQNSTSSWNTPVNGFNDSLSPSSYEAYSRSNTATGQMGYLAEFKARTGGFNGGVPVEHAAFYSMDMGLGGMTAAYGMLLENQTGATDNYGIVLRGDGAGSDVVFGAGLDASILYDGTNMVIDPQLVGTGGVFIDGQAAIGTGAQVGGEEIGGSSILAVKASTSVTGSIDASAMELDFTATGASAFAIPIGLKAKATIETTNTGAKPKGIKAVLVQNSAATWSSGDGTGIPQSAAIWGEINSTAGTGTGSLKDVGTIVAQYPNLAGGGGADNIYGLFVADQGEANVTTATGIWVQPPVFGSPTNSYGIVLDGDGAGADIIFGEGQDASILYDGTNLVVTSDIVGTGGMHVPTRAAFGSLSTVGGDTSGVDSIVHIKETTAATNATGMDFHMTVTGANSNSTATAFSGIAEYAGSGGFFLPDLVGVKSQILQSGSTGWDVAQMFVADFDRTTDSSAGVISGYLVDNWMEEISGAGTIASEANGFHVKDHSINTSFTGTAPTTIRGLYVERVNPIWGSASTIPVNSYGIEVKSQPSVKVSGSSHAIWLNGNGGDASLALGGNKTGVIYGNNNKIVLEPFWSETGSGIVQIGTGKADHDYILRFTGETNTLNMTWMEDEAYLDFDSTIKTNGNIENINTTAKTANYTIIATDDNIITDTSGGAFTITLPASPETGRLYTVILETAGNILTIDGNGNNINGSATIPMDEEGLSRTFLYTSTQWVIK